MSAERRQRSRSSTIITAVFAAVLVLSLIAVVLFSSVGPRRSGVESGQLDPADLIDSLTKAFATGLGALVGAVGTLAGVYMKLKMARLERRRVEIQIDAQQVQLDQLRRQLKAQVEQPSS